MVDFIDRKAQQRRKLGFFLNGPNHKNCVQATMLSLIKQNHIIVIKEGMQQNTEKKIPNPVLYNRGVGGGESTDISRINLIQES